MEYDHKQAGTVAFIITAMVAFVPCLMLELHSTIPAILALIAGVSTENYVKKKNKHNSKDQKNEVKPKQYGEI